MRISSIRTFIALTTFASAVVLFTGTAQAQVRTGGLTAQERRDKLKNMTPEERKAALAKAKENRKDRAANLTDAQKAWMKAEAAEMKTVRDGVKAGTITKQSAAAQLKAWREANPRPKSSGDEN